MISVLDKNLFNDEYFVEITGVEDIKFENIEVTEDYIFIAAIEVCLIGNQRMPSLHVFDRHTMAFLERQVLNDKVSGAGLYFVKQLQDEQILVVENILFDSCEDSDEERSLRFTKFEYPNFKISQDTTRFCGLVVTPKIVELQNGELIATSNHFTDNGDIFPLAHIMDNILNDLDELTGEPNGAVTMKPIVTGTENHYFYQGFKYEYQNESDFETDITWLRKMDLNHNELFERHYKIPGYSMGIVDIVEHEDMNYVFAVARDEENGGPRDLILIGLTKDMCYDDDCSDVIILDQLVSTIDDPNVQEGFSIYPNPTQDYITIDFINSQSKEAQIRLYDSAGQLHAQQVKPIGNNSLQMELSDYRAGVYMVEILIKGDDRSIYRRVVVL